MRAKAKIALFLGILVVWVGLDQLAKSFFAGMEPDGSVMAGPFLGLVDIRLVHNTGGAWGIFSDETTILAVFSTVVCLALAVFFFATVKKTTIVQTISFALIVAGGMGNAIDRFAQGYVTDFIEFSFVSFPVFNMADIGVTCGFALLILTLLLGWQDGDDDYEEASR